MKRFALPGFSMESHTKVRLSMEKDSVKENRKVVFRVPSGQHLSNLYRVSVPKGSPNKKDARGVLFIW